MIYTVNASSRTAVSPLSLLMQSAYLARSNHMFLYIHFHAVDHILIPLASNPHSTSSIRILPVRTAAQFPLVKAR